MKKIVSFICALAMLLLLASCGNGKSIPVSIVGQYNKTVALLSGDTVAYTEKIEYFSPEARSYEIYYELSQDFSYVYNIAEKIGDYAMYAKSGDVYTEKDGVLCAVLFANPTVTFPKFINDYIDVAFPLDGGTRYQRSSAEDGDYITVTYYADVTPQMASGIYSVSLDAGEKIISTYKLDESYRIYQIEYSVESADGSLSDVVARRSFTYYSERQDVFASLPDDSGESATITLDYGTRKSTFTVPVGVYVGFDDGGSGYEYYTDAEMNFKYALSPAQDMIVYVKTNFD